MSLQKQKEEKAVSGLQRIKLQYHDELIDVYNLGFNDGLKNILSEVKFQNKYIKRSYNLGREHALIGDEVSSIDRLSNDEIIDMILGIPPF
jgi:hypothetical protein